MIPMNDQEVARRLTSLEARMNRIETLIHQLLVTLTSSRAHIEQTQQMQTLLEELRSGPYNHTSAMQQELPEIAAIRKALLAGNKVEAIKLYRSLYGVGLNEAKKAIDAM